MRAGFPIAWLSPWWSSPRFATQVSVTLSANAGIAGLGVLSGLLLARLLGPESRGELAAMQVWASLLASLAVFGLGDAMAHFSAKHPDEAGRYFKSALTLATGIACLAAAIGFEGLPLLLHAHSDQTLGYARRYLLIVPVQVALMVAFGLIRGRGWVAKWNLLRVAQTGNWLVLIVVLAAAGGCDPGNLVTVYLVVQFVFAIVVIGNLFRRGFGGRGGRVGELVRFAAPNFASQAPQLLARNMDQLLLVSLVPAAALGGYVVAAAWSGLAAALSQAVAPLVIPRVSGAPDGGDRSRLTTRLTRSSVAVMLPIGLLVALLAPRGLPLVFGKEFSNSGEVAAILAIAATVGGLNRLLAEVLRGYRDFSVLLVAEMAGLATTTLLAVLLVPRHGISGAAWAVLAGQAAVVMLAARGVSHSAGVPISRLLIPGKDTVSELRTAFQLALHSMRGNR